MKYFKFICLLLMNACVAGNTQAQAFFKFFGDSTQNQTLDGGIATDDGGYILYGGYYVPAAGGKLASFLKTDAAGNLLWKKHLSFVNMEPRHIKAVVELPSHELMLLRSIKIILITRDTWLLKQTVREMFCGQKTILFLILFHARFTGHCLPMMVIFCWALLPAAYHPYMANKPSIN